MTDEKESSERLSHAVAEGDGIEVGEDETSTCPDEEDVGGRMAPSVDPDYREERFRVDRRKLEQLLQVVEGERKVAEEFFSEVMQETGTTIVWPSKLKIGAKSKKDPLIKICGLKNAVLQAKEKIMNTLDTKSLRVTLKMEVSHTEHSHVIGKGGSNVQRVMQETDCHIHFPDSNRSNLGEKSNQVSITGQHLAVESARVKIRMLLPLVILFELPICPSVPVHLDGSSAVIQQTQQQYGVSIIVKQHLQTGRGHVRTIIIRGSVCDAKSVEEASIVLFETLTSQVGMPFTVTLLMDIASSHLPMIIGYDGSNIKQIFRRTGATVYFPDTTATISPRSTLYITGGVQNVFLARDELMGWLPVVLMFDVREEKEIETGQTVQLMEQLDVFISLKPKVRQPLKSVIVKSTERNVNNVYEARKLLLSLVSESLTSGSCSASNSAKPSTPMRNDSKKNTSGSTGYQLSFPNGGVINRSHIIPSTVLPPYLSASPGFQPVIILPSVQSYHLPVAFPSTRPGGVHFQSVKAPPSAGFISTGNRLGTDEPSVSPVSKIPATEPCESIAASKLTASLSWSSGLSLHCDKASSMLSPRAAGSYETADYSPKTPSATSFVETSFLSGPEKESMGSANSFDSSTVLGSESLLKLCLQNSASLLKTNSQLCDSALGSASHASLSPYQSNESNEKLSLFANRENSDDMSCTGFQKIDAHKSRGESSPPTTRRFGQLPSPSDQNPTAFHHPNELLYPNDSSSDPSKAPGRGRPKKSVCSSLLTSNDLYADFDYEEMKLFATRAVQQKPLGNSRIPTDCWSGLYFSKSMPDSALCDKLSQNIVRYRGLPATNKSTDSDDNSWKSSMHSYERDRLESSPLSSVPEGHCLGSGSNLSDIASALTTSTEFSGDQTNRPQAFDDPLSKLLEIWRPKTTAERNAPQEPSDLAELFSKLGLGKYTDLFQQQEIDLSTFLTLTENDLKELGISTFGARRKMLLAIADHNERRHLVPPPPGLPNPFSQSGRW